ncbi:MAG: tetratricopeptide repeat protein [Halorhodospira sp.]
MSMMTPRRLFFPGAALWLGLLLGGCYVPPDDGVARGDGKNGEDSAEQQRQDGAEDDGGGGWWGEEEETPQDDQPGQEDERVAVLAQQGREAYDQGDYEEAAQRLEAALERAPRRAVLWQNLAAVRYQQGQYRRAEELALRAVDTGDEDPAVLREAWWLVAAARKEQGDQRGARDAAATAQRFGETGEERFGPSLR